MNNYLLRSCPHCGGEARLENIDMDTSFGDEYFARVFCTKCGVKTPSISYNPYKGPAGDEKRKAMERAISIWNREPEAEWKVKLRKMRGTAPCCTSCEKYVSIETKYCPNCGKRMKNWIDPEKWCEENNEVD